MRIYATVFDNFDARWQICIAPRKMKTKDGKPLKLKDTEASSKLTTIFSTWQPQNDTGENVQLYYEPQITIGVKPWDKSIPGVNVPIHKLYSIESAVSAVYQSLNTKGLFTVTSEGLVIDSKIANSLARKVVGFGNNLVFRPTLAENKEGRIKGIEVLGNGLKVTSMTHESARAFCEMLSHLDVTTFTMMLAMMERFVALDEKIDKVLENQGTILQRLDHLCDQLPKTEKSTDPTTRPAEEFRDALTGSGFDWSAIW